jgi:hypothetical protein
MSKIKRGRVAPRKKTIAKGTGRRVTRQTSKTAAARRKANQARWEFRNGYTSAPATRRGRDLRTYSWDMVLGREPHWKLPTDTPVPRPKTAYGTIIHGRPRPRDARQGRQMDYPIQASAEEYVEVTAIGMATKRLNWLIEERAETDSNPTTRATGMTRERVEWLTKEINSEEKTLREVLKGYPVHLRLSKERREGMTTPKGQTGKAIVRARVSRGIEKERYRAVRDKRDYNVAWNTEGRFEAYGIGIATKDIQWLEEELTVAVDRYFENYTGAPSQIVKGLPRAPGMNKAGCAAADRI